MRKASKSTQPTGQRPQGGRWDVVDVLGKVGDVGAAAAVLAALYEATAPAVVAGAVALTGYTGALVVSARRSRRR